MKEEKKQFCKLLQFKSDDGNIITLMGIVDDEFEHQIKFLTGSGKVYFFEKKEILKLVNTRTPFKDKRGSE